jgi:mRNA interferase YafQ
MLEIIFRSQFEKDYNKAEKQNLDLTLLDDIITKLSNNELLDSRCRPHALKGDYSNWTELHIKGDWLLIYRIVNNDKLLLYRTGTHSELF